MEYIYISFEILTFSAFTFAATFHFSLFQPIVRYSQFKRQCWCRSQSISSR